jgi:hypothetical protein
MRVNGGYAIARRLAVSLVKNAQTAKFHYLLLRAGTEHHRIDMLLRYLPGLEQSQSAVKSG